MSSKNLTGCGTESECDFYSDRWEDSVIHINKDLSDSSSESDVNSDASILFENAKGKKLSDIVLILENNQSNSIGFCKNCPLLPTEKVRHTGKQQEELSPESVLYLKFKDYCSNGHSLTSFSTKIVPFTCSGSYRDPFSLNKSIPQLIVIEHSDEGHTFYTVKEAYAFPKFHQKQSSADKPLPSKSYKAVKISSGEIKAEENISSECVKQSSILTEKNKVPKKSTIFENHLVNHSDDSLKNSYQIDNPQIAEQIYSQTNSEDTSISLMLEAVYISPSGSLISNIDPSNVRVDEDSQGHALAFQYKDSEHKQLFKKLHGSLSPQKQIKHLKKQVKLSQILTDESSHVLATPRESFESSSPDVHSDQVSSPSKHWSSSWSSPLSEYTYAIQTSHCFVGSLPQYPIQAAFQKRKHKPVKSVVFIKRKTIPKDPKFRSKQSISSKFHLPKFLHIEPTNKNKTRETKINDHQVPLNQTSKCYCSPLLDLTVDLHSEERNSEKFLGFHRRPHKQAGVGKVIRRCSSHCLLSPKHSSERFCYICPIRKKHKLKMQNILNYFLDWTGEQNKGEKYKEGIAPTSKIRANEAFISHLPADKKSSTVPHSTNYSVPLTRARSFSDERKHSSIPSWQTERRNPTALYLFPNECKHSSSPCVQNEKNPWSPVASHGKCSISHSCANAQEELPKNLSMFSNISVGKPVFGTGQIAGGGLALKKFSVCSCGTMSQSGLLLNDTSESDRKKTKACVDSNWKANKIDSYRRNSTGTFSTQEMCCSCHHISPTSSSYNTSCKHEAPRNQVIKVASLFENGFPIRNQKDDEKESKTGGRKVRFHLGSDILQEPGFESTRFSSPPNKCCQKPKHFVSQPECSCCQTAVKEHLGTSKEVPTCCSEHNIPKNYLNRDSIFLVDPNCGIKNQCKCSHEISLFNSDQTDSYKGTRVSVSKQKDPNLIQDSSKINHGWKKPEHFNCCCGKVQYNRFQ